MNTQEIHGTHIAAEQLDDNMHFGIHPVNHQLRLQFTCGRCEQLRMCVGVCLDRDKHSWYTGPQLMRYDNGAYICPDCQVIRDF
jgi:hypothetical protein